MVQNIILYFIYSVKNFITLPTVNKDRRFTHQMYKIYSTGAYVGYRLWIQKNIYINRTKGKKTFLKKCV